MLNTYKAFKKEHPRLTNNIIFECNKLAWVSGNAYVSLVDNAGAGSPGRLYTRRIVDTAGS